MGSKTLGYLLFIAACLAAAAVLGFRAISSSDDVAAQVAAATAPRAPSAVPNPTPTVPGAALPAPPTRPAAPPQAVNDVIAALRESLAKPGNTTREVFYGIAQQRPWKSPLVDVSRMPILTPAQVRTAPIARRASTRPAIAVSGQLELPPLAIVLDSPRPHAIRLVTGRGYACETFVQPLPLIRMPMVLRPRPEALPAQGEPILDVHGTINLPLLPSFRTAPAPAVRNADAPDRRDDVKSTPLPEADPPRGTRPLLPREPMPSVK